MMLRSRAVMIALVWTAIGVCGAGLFAVRLWSLGHLELWPRQVLGALFFIVLWALATEGVFRAVARRRVDGWRVALGYAASGALFFVLSNALARVPVLVTRGVPPYLRDLVAGLSEFAPPAMLAFAGIVFLAHRLTPVARVEAPAVLSVADRGVTHLVPVPEILWLEAEDNYVLIHTPARSYTARQKIGELESRLSAADFLRVHRSALVRATAIRAIRPRGRGDFEVVLSDGTAVRGARTRRAAVEALLS